jgi:hypothetical protein
VAEQDRALGIDAWLGAQVSNGHVEVSAESVPGRPHRAEIEPALARPVAGEI